MVRLAAVVLLSLALAVHAEKWSIKFSSIKIPGVPDHEIQSADVFQSDKSFLFEPQPIVRQKLDCGYADADTGAQEVRPGVWQQNGIYIRRKVQRSDVTQPTYMERWASEVFDCDLDPSCRRWKVRGRWPFAKDITVTFFTPAGDAIRAFSFVDCYPLSHTFSPVSFCVPHPDMPVCLETEEVRIRCMGGYRSEQLPRRPPAPPAEIDLSWGYPEDPEDIPPLVRGFSTAIIKRQSVTPKGACVRGFGEGLDPTCVTPIIEFHPDAAKTLDACVCQAGLASCSCQSPYLVFDATTVRESPGGDLCTTDPCPRPKPLIQLIPANLPSACVVCVIDDPTHPFDCRCPTPVLTIRTYLFAYTGLTTDDFTHSDPTAPPAAPLTSFAVLPCHILCITDPCCPQLWASPARFNSTGQVAADGTVGQTATGGAVGLPTGSQGGCVCIQSSDAAARPCTCTNPVATLKMKAPGPAVKVCGERRCKSPDVDVWVTPQYLAVGGCFCKGICRGLPCPVCPCGNVHSSPQEFLRASGGGMGVVRASCGGDDEDCDGVVDSVLEDMLDYAIKEQGVKMAISEQGVPKKPPPKKGFTYMHPVHLAFDMLERYGEEHAAASADLRSGRRKEEPKFKYRTIEADKCTLPDMPCDDNITLVLHRTVPGSGSGVGSGIGSSYDGTVSVFGCAAGAGEGSGSSSGHFEGVLQGTARESPTRFVIRESPTLAKIDGEMLPDRRRDWLNLSAAALKQTETCGPAAADGPPNKGWIEVMSISQGRESPSRPSSGTIGVRESPTRPSCGLPILNSSLPYDVSARSALFDCRLPSRDAYDSGIAQNFQMRHYNPVSGLVKVTELHNSFLSELSLPSLSYANSQPGQSDCCRQESSCCRQDPLSSCCVNSCCVVIRIKLDGWYSTSVTVKL